MTTTCFENNCNGTDLQTADATARENCALAGVTLSTPSATADQTTSTDASKKHNGADSIMVNIMGGAAALGLAALAL